MPRIGIQGGLVALNRFEIVCEVGIGPRQRRNRREGLGEARARGSGWWCQLREDFAVAHDQEGLAAVVDAAQEVGEAAGRFGCCDGLSHGPRIIRESENHKPAGV